MPICNVNFQVERAFRIKLLSGNVRKSESIICGRDKVDCVVLRSWSDSGALFT